jgi:hypothetical protein
MSGDIGRGATRETVSFGVHMASVPERPPGKQSQPLEQISALCGSVLSTAVKYFLLLWF